MKIPLVTEVYVVKDLVHYSKLTSIQWCNV